MQNIKVETKISLLSGAEIQLTDTQSRQVSRFVYSMLFDSQPEEAPIKRKYTRRKNLARWTPEEDEILMSVVNAPEKTDKMILYKKIKKQLNRSTGSMYNRAYYLKKLQEEQQKSFTNTKTELPVYINSTWS